VTAYQYAPRTNKELKEIADIILHRFPDRRRGYSVEVEGIVEDLGITILPRPISKIPIDGYVAADCRYILVNELQFRLPNRLRFTVAEELSHLILEFHLWENGKVPEGARCHEISQETWRAIERDAKQLAASILLPEDVFQERFAFHYTDLRSANIDEETSTKIAIKKTAFEMRASNRAAANRAYDLRIINDTQREHLFPVLL